MTQTVKILNQIKFSDMIQTENNTKNSIAQTEESMQLVVFELDKEEYAVKIAELQEIITIPEVTPIPNAPAFISGILNLRGRIVVVVDLEKRFNLVREHGEVVDGNIIITEVEENNFGVIVDKVNEIITVPLSSIQAAPSLVSTKINAEYLNGVVVLKDKKTVAGKEGDQKDGSRLVILLDLHKMLQEKELLALSKIVQKTAE